MRSPEIKNQNNAARFVSVMGVRDGAGASDFSLQLARQFRKEGKDVLLVDADPEFAGDLARLCADKSRWRTLKEVEKLPKRVEKNWLHGFLKDREGICRLALFSGEAAPPSSLEAICPFFDCVIADIGSRWHPFIFHLLEKCDPLLFILNPQPGQVEALQRRAAGLIRSYFPLPRAGWAAWHWNDKSFLAPSSVSDLTRLACLGDSAAAVAASIGKRGPALQFPSTFEAERLLSGGRTAGEKTRPLPCGDADENNPDAAVKLDLLQAIQTEMEAKGLQGEKETEALRHPITKIILEVMESKKGLLPPSADKTALVGELLNEILGLGPLETLLADPHLGEILVNGPGLIYAEKKGRLYKTPLRFLNADSLQKVIERILLPVGRRVDVASPMVDARLKDGSRVNIILPPLALNGPVVSIRRFSGPALSPADLVGLGAASEAMIAFLRDAVRGRKNILVSGGTGSGKTTLLNLLSSFIPEGERIITIEDAAELKLQQPHVVRLESRPANIEGKGAVTIRDLVCNALRMRPDRIVVGECRGGEALDMLQAMNTGHEGSLTTLHANTPRDALNRLETLVLFSGMNLPSRVIREQIASAIDFIVQAARFPDGGRKITQISEITGLEGDVFLLQDFFVWEEGTFKNTGSYL